MVIIEKSKILCPVLNNAKVITYEQKIIKFNKFKIILTYSLNKEKHNDKVIVFFPGYNNYFYYHNIRLLYPDYDFFSLDIPGYGFNGSNPDYPYEHNGIKVQPNYFDNVDNICDMINTTLSTNYTEENDNINIKKYSKKYLLGFSTGGFIATYYVWKCDTKNNDYFKFDKLLLISPLVGYYINKNYVISSLINVVISFISLFNHKQNLKGDIGKQSPASDKLKTILSSIYSHMSVNNINNINHYINTTNFDNILSKTRSGAYSGWINNINNSVSLMVKSKKKITTNVKLVCSLKHKIGNEFNADEFIMPDFIINNLNNIIDKNKFSYKHFDCCHDAMIQPFSNYFQNIIDIEEITNISFIEIMNELIN